MSLLGNGFDDPQSAAIMALAGGLLQGNFGGGLLGANQAYSESKQNAAKQKFMDMQMQNYASEIEQRKAAVEKQKMLSDMAQRIITGGGASPAAPGQLGSGSFGAIAPPQGMSDIPAPRPAGLGGANLNDIVALHAAGGPDLLSAYKLSREGFERKPGTFYENVNGGREYIGDPTKGLGFQNGRITMMPGAENIAALAGQTAQAQEAAKAGFDPIKVYNSATQREEFVPRSQVVGGQPQPAKTIPPQFRQPQVQPQSGPAPTGNFVGDPAAIMEAITQIRDPQERANAMAAFTEQAKRTQGFAQSGFAAGPSAGEAASAAGAKVKAEADARAGAERDATMQKGAINSKDTLNYIKEARQLFKKGPTNSGFGSLVDTGANFLGMSTPGAEAAAQLDTLSGWMVSNVPRMEGPQSNFDVQNYKTMAGMVGDSTKPLSQRIAALDTLERLQNKYAHLNGGGEAAPQQPAQRPMLDSLPKTAPKGQKVRDTETGKILQFNGLSWVEVK